MLSFIKGGGKCVTTKRSEDWAIRKNGEEGSLILLGFAHQVSTEHEEADEVDVGQVAAAAELFTRLSVGFRVTASAGQSCQHNLLPLLSSGTSTSTQREGSIST